MSGFQVAVSCKGFWNASKLFSNSCLVLHAYGRMCLALVLLGFASVTIIMLAVLCLHEEPRSLSLQYKALFTAGNGTRLKVGKARGKIQSFLLSAGAPRWAVQDTHYSRGQGGSFENVPMAFLYFSQKLRWLGFARWQRLAAERCRSTAYLCGPYLICAPK